MQDTSKQYDAVIDTCKNLFTKKMSDYGSAWRILRLPSLTDQIYIKAQRIRGLQQNDVRKVDEGEVSEFIGIINYCIMALIQLEKGVVEQPDLSTEESKVLYEKQVAHHLGYFQSLLSLLLRPYLPIVMIRNDGY